ncbi:MAG: 50S ribosomal protein L9 [Planctomycetes bacterium]|nr:50S ribosomal protein L9 [Planctomycetota bacterium]
MKLLLAEDVRHLGKAGDIVNVRDGYARNYLVPQGLALVPTQGNIERVEELRKKRQADLEARKARLAEAAAILEGTSITIKAQANEQGHLFGSVTQKDIAAALQAMGHKIDAEQILLAEPIRMLDRFQIPVRLEEGFEANIDLWVVPEEA